MYILPPTLFKKLVRRFRAVGFSKLIDQAINNRKNGEETQPFFLFFLVIFHTSIGERKKNHAQNIVEDTLEEHVETWMEKISERKKRKNKFFSFLAYRTSRI
jgi:hypothetical protein